MQNSSFLNGAKKTFINIKNGFNIRSFSSAIERAYTPRRALMYVPASDDRKLAKIANLKADCVVLDCEDGVAITRKDEARRKAAEFLQTFSKNNGGARRIINELGVRVNSASSGLLEDDLKALSTSQKYLQAIMLPKVDSVKDLHHFWELFTKYFTSVSSPVNLVIWIESARALIDMPKILEAADQLKKSAPVFLDAVVFGSDDLCADIGATRSKEATELSYARQKFLLVCKAFRLQAIDLVFIDYKDLHGLQIQCDEARRMGFTGKQVIHPDQIDIVQKAFLPPEEKIQWARQLVAEFEEHEKSGKGAFTFSGQMIDMPLVLQARNIVRLMEKIQERELIVA